MEMSESQAEQNKALVLEAFDTLFNQARLRGSERYCRPTTSQHSAHIEPGPRWSVQADQEHSSDLRYESGVAMASGDLVMVHAASPALAPPQNWITLDIVRLENDFSSSTGGRHQDEGQGTVERAEFQCRRQVSRLGLKEELRNWGGNTIFITWWWLGIGRGLAEALHALGNQIYSWTPAAQSHLAETTGANPGMPVRSS